MNIKNILKRLISGKWFPLYHAVFADAKLKEHMILLESRGGGRRQYSPYPHGITEGTILQVS